MNTRTYFLCLSAAILLLMPGLVANAAGPTHAQGEMAGEATESSIILQSRLTKGNPPFKDDVPGSPGVARFEVSRHEDFANSFFTEWLTAEAERDFIVKVKVSGLDAGTRYFYRLHYGKREKSAKAGPACSFQTLYGAETAAEVSVAVVTGMNYYPFHWKSDAPDEYEGYPALVTLERMKPDYFIGTGDNVYYDQPIRPRAKTLEELRKKWHEQFVQPRFAELFRHVPTYWQKDDHDHRYNDSDATTDQEPSHALGIRTFIEQMPVADPNDPNPLTYRTRRVSRDLQLWFVEGRDYRTPSMDEDGPEKTIWGAEQRAWLKRTLLESDAAFKLLISPTPMIGPDDTIQPAPAFEGQDIYKRDNHSNIKGYRYERDQFFAWLAKNDLLSKGFYIVCGDRHWQYHSISPEGVEEFSCGALVDANSRLGRKPGDPKSNDPEGLIRQPYTQSEKSGGFLILRVRPEQASGPATLTFTWHDEKGAVLHETEKGADG